jgi:hypothetical protein
MDDTLCQDFFRQPRCPSQRQYEALRAVFVEGVCQKEAARRFGYSYDAFRQLVHQFRAACAAGTPPPLLAGAAPPTGTSPAASPSRRRSPTPGP